MNSIYPLLTGILVAGSLLHAGETQVINDGFLAQMRSEAARAHPSAIAAKHKANAASHDVRSVRLWNDPMVGLGFMQAEEMMQMDDGDLMLDIEQALPKPGMYAAERRKMEAMSRAENENSRSSALAAGADAARSAIELALADELIVLQQAQIDWYAAMTENARQMAADPMGSSADALRMSVEVKATPKSSTLHSAAPWIHHGPC